MPKQNRGKNIKSGRLPALPLLQQKNRQWCRVNLPSTQRERFAQPRRTRPTAKRVVRYRFSIQPFKRSAREPAATTSRSAHRVLWAYPKALMGFSMARFSCAPPRHRHPVPCTAAGLWPRAPRSWGLVRVNTPGLNGKNPYAGPDFWGSKLPIHNMPTNLASNPTQGNRKQE